MLLSQEKEHPVNIDTGVADKFKDLRTDIQKFSTDFLQYLDDKREKLEQEAERLQNLIKRLKEELDKCVLCSRYVLIPPFLSSSRRIKDQVFCRLFRKIIFSRNLFRSTKFS